MDRIAYTCAGDIPNCKRKEYCQKICGHTTNREYSLNYKTHEPSEEELSKNFDIVGQSNGCRYLMEKAFEEGFAGEAEALF